MNSSYNVLINQTQNSKPSQYTSSDLYLLAKTIYAESRGEPYTGQVAVGAVILNRVRSSQFPNTVSGVVYQKHAFTAVSDGQINLTPDNTAMRAGTGRRKRLGTLRRGALLLQSRRSDEFLDFRAQDDYRHR